MYVYQRCMNKCFDDLTDTNCIPYLDNVQYYERMFDEHLQSVKIVLKRLKGFGIKLKAHKCAFFKSEVKYLAKIITSESYWGNPINPEAIKK